MLLVRLHQGGSEKAGLLKPLLANLFIYHTVNL
jgi:hypothetical protein